jgi:hypothetical protein
MIPEPDAALTDPAIVDAVTLLQSVIELGRGVRARQDVNISVKQPLRSIVVVHADAAKLELLKKLETCVARPPFAAPRSYCARLSPPARLNSAHSQRHATAPARSSVARARPIRPIHRSPFVLRFAGTL